MYHSPAYAEAHRRLAELQIQLRARAHTQQTLAALRQQLQDAREQHKRADANLYREGRDVARLEGVSIAALIATLRGTRDDDLIREREEELAARLAAEAGAAAVTNLEAEEAALVARLAAYGDLDTAHAAALRVKHEAIIAAGYPAAQQLHDLDTALADRDATALELDEALWAGEATDESLQAVLTALKSAQGWGTYDMLGGGLLATAIKHQRIDEARTAAQTAGRRLRRFQAELGDVHLATDSGGLGAIDTLATIGDYLFDGLLIDWFVQAKIDRARDQTSRYTRLCAIFLPPYRRNNRPFSRNGPTSLPNARRSSLMRKLQSMTTVDRSLSLNVAHDPIRAAACRRDRRLELRVELGGAGRCFAATHANRRTDLRNDGSGSIEDLQRPVAIGKVVVRLPDHQIAYVAPVRTDAQTSIRNNQRPCQQGGRHRTAAHTQLRHRYIRDRRTWERRHGTNGLVGGDCNHMRREC